MGSSNELSRLMIGRSCRPDADTVAELEPERVHLVDEAELLGLGPDRGDLVGGGARLDQVDGRVHPLPRPLERVALGRGGPADHERAVVAGAVAAVDVDDVEVGLVARADQPVGEHVGMRAAPLAGDRVDGLDELGAHLEQPGVGQADDVALPHAGLQRLEDVVVHAVDHGAGLGEQR